MHTEEWDWPKWAVILSVTSILLPVPTPIHIPTNDAPGCEPFLCILTNKAVVCCLWGQSFWQVWGDTSLWVWSISLMIRDAEHLFMCLLSIYISSLGKCLVKSSVGIFFFYVELSEFFVYFGHKGITLTGYTTCRHRHPLSRWSRLDWDCLSHLRVLLPEQILELPWVPAYVYKMNW